MSEVRYLFLRSIVMFSASYCQNEKNMYEKANKPNATITTYEAM